MDQRPSTSQHTNHPSLPSSPLALRIVPALVALGLGRDITWFEAAFVLDAVEDLELRCGVRYAVAYRLLGGEVVSWPGFQTQEAI